MRAWVLLLVAIGSTVASAASSSTAMTPEFRLSVKHDGVRASAGEETLRYSTLLWDGDTNATSTVTLAQNGTTLVGNLTGEGDQAWSVTRNGTYNLTHTTYTNGAVAAVLNATFTATGKDEPFPEGDVTVTGYDGKYDGQPHSISVTITGIENPTITYALDAAGPFGATNPTFTTVTNQTVWCVIAAEGYITETNSVNRVWREDVSGGTNVVPLSLPGLGPYRVYIVEVAEPTKCRHSAHDLSDTVANTVASRARLKTGFRKFARETRLDRATARTLCQPFQLLS